MEPFQAKPLPWFTSGHSTNRYPGFLSEASIKKHYNLYLEDIRSLNNYTRLYPELRNLTITQIAINYIGIIGDLAGRIINHEFYWKILSPTPQTPSGEVYRYILKTYGSYEFFVQKFQERLEIQYTPGWIWLFYDPSLDLLVIDSGDGSYNPIVNGNLPLIGLDFWEHAYLDDYGRDYQRYLQNFLNYLNWAYLDELLKAQIKA